MGILGKIFGTDKAINAMVSAGDKLVFTEEEKAERWERLLKLYEPFKLAQRLLALIVAVPYMAAWIWTFILCNTSLVTDSNFALLNGDIGKAFLIILAFYFAGGTIESFRKK